MAVVETKKPRVLIIDDEEQIRSLLIDVLSDSYQCSAAGSAEEALAALANTNFDLVISDIDMGGMSGLELVPHVHSLWPDTVVVMVSGNSDIEFAIRALLVTGDTGRWDPLAETLLHYAARREHIARRILPALEAGKWVVCDRFIDSTLAYQGYGLGVPLDAIARIRAATLGDFAPDLTLILDVTPATRQARTTGRPGNGAQATGLSCGPDSANQPSPSQ